MDVQHRDPGPGEPPAARASDQERDAALVRLHLAFAEGRLSSPELDQRMDAVLASRTRGELDRLLADLPTDGYGELPGAAPAGGGEPAASGGRWHVAYKTGISRSGRLRLPRSCNFVLYKSDGVVDLSKAGFDGPVTVLRVLAYKSGLHIVVPPGVQVELGGLGVSAALDHAAGPGAPLLRVKGIAYKGSIDIRSRSKEL